MSVIFAFIAPIVLALAFSLTACASSGSMAMDDFCNPIGGDGLGTSTCTDYLAQQQGIAESFVILEPGGLPQNDLLDGPLPDLKG
ncbi:quinolinate synthetase [Synechococcus sp. RedBA-s]|nr:quinolinate synthetase [Synechococcus sp. RedBA-s]